VRPTRSRANLASYISSDDYPAEALHNGEEGTVGFRLYISPEGRAAGCTISSSSGSASLDETTCSIMMARARFTPAIDYRGRPTHDTLSARVRWRLADDEAGKEGESATAPLPTVGVPMQRARPIAPLKSYLSHHDYPLEGAGDQRPPISRFSLSVEPDGSVAACEIIVESGWPLLDRRACEVMESRARFTPARDATGNAVADSYWGHVDWREFEHAPVRVPGY
jgi:TonB family protein